MDDCVSVLGNELLAFLSSREFMRSEAYIVSSSYRNEEIVMPSERSGKIRENYDWKVRIKTSMFVVCLQSFLSRLVGSESQICSNKRRILVNRALYLRNSVLYPNTRRVSCKPETQSRKLKCIGNSTENMDTDVRKERVDHVTLNCKPGLI